MAKQELHLAILFHRGEWHYDVALPLSHSASHRFTRWAQRRNTRETCEETVQTLRGGKEKKRSEKIGGAVVHISISTNFSGKCQRCAAAASTISHPRSNNESPFPDSQTLPPFPLRFITNQPFTIQRHGSSIPSCISSATTYKRKYGGKSPSGNAE